MSEPAKEELAPELPVRKDNRRISSEIMGLFDDPVEMTLPAMRFGGLWWTPMSTDLLNQFYDGPTMVMLAPDIPINVLDQEDIKFVGLWWAIVFIPTALAKKILHIIALGADSGEMLGNLAQTIKSTIKTRRATRSPASEPAGYT
jgi:hypothetical protein